MLSSVLDYKTKGGVQMPFKIREFREQQGLSQTKLAEKSGVSRQTINGLETGTIKITTTDTLIKIAEALNRKVGEIFYK